MEDDPLTAAIIGCAMRAHDVLGPGFLESVYRNALAFELRTTGHAVECECLILVRYRGCAVGRFAADLFVDGRVLVELKAVRAIAPAHEAQLVNYLTATGVDAGVLLNFGASRLEFRRRTRFYAGRAKKK